MTAQAIARFGVPPANTGFPEYFLCFFFLIIIHPGRKALRVKWTFTCWLSPWSWLNLIFLLCSVSQPRQADYNAQHRIIGKQFCLLLSKCKPVFFRWGEKCFTAGFRSWQVSCMLPWVIQPVTAAGGCDKALPWPLMKGHLTSEYVAQKTSKILGEKEREGRGRDMHNRHYLQAESELPLLLLPWKSSPRKVKNTFLYLTHSLSRKYAPDTALFTQDILLREFLIRTQCWK